MKINNWQQHRISRIIIEKFFGTISAKKITILGFSFKANTNDIRNSAAISICKDLLNEGAFLNIHDPKVDFDKVKENLENISISQNETYVSERKKIISRKMGLY